MSRAVLLPFPGDPFLLNYWLNLFDTVWGKETNALYVGLNSPIEEPMVRYILARLKKTEYATGVKVVVHRQDMMADHGPTINKLLDLVTEDHVLLIEDDGFIFKPGVVERYFQYLESGQYDIVGGKRGSCAMEILTAAQQKWGLTYEGEGDHGPNFWPNFLLLSKELLLRTDRNFAAKAWHKGDTIVGLDHVVVGDILYGDTFVNTSLQLRGLIPQERILCVPQYHGSPDDLDHARAGKYLFDGNAPWTHVGSLSSGVGGVLRDEKNRHLDKRLTDTSEIATALPAAWCTTDAERREWERRIQWWLTFWETAERPSNPEQADFYDAYGRAVQQVIDQYSLAVNSIRQRQKVYKQLLGI